MPNVQYNAPWFTRPGAPSPRPPLPSHTHAHTHTQRAPATHCSVVSGCPPLPPADASPPAVMLPLPPPTLPSLLLPSLRLLRCCRRRVFPVSRCSSLRGSGPPPLISNAPQVTTSAISPTTRSSVSLPGAWPGTPMRDTSCCCHPLTAVRVPDHAQGAAAGQPRDATPRHRRRGPASTRVPAGGLAGPLLPAACTFRVQRRSRSLRHAELKVSTPAHAKNLGWYLEFEFRVQRMIMVHRGSNQGLRLAVPRTDQPTRERRRRWGRQRRR